MPTSIRATCSDSSDAATSGRDQQGLAATVRPRAALIVREGGAGAHGFTLLEMLVALTIFSLAALALVRLQAVSARTSVDLRERTMAQIAARNLMIERLTDPRPPAVGTSNGVVENGGRQWRWTQQVDLDADEPRLMVITIRVAGGLGQSPAVLTFGRPA